MSLHKLTAGDGYTYLTRQVAAADATHRGYESLQAYYTQRGEAPGLWTGRGLAALSDGVAALADAPSGLAVARVGAVVSEAQMRALFGAGRHPDADLITERMRAAGRDEASVAAATRLGLPFKTFDAATSYRRRVAAAFGQWNAERGLPADWPVPAEERARLRTDVAQRMFAETYERPPLDARELSGFVARASRQPTTAVAGYDLTFSPVKSVSALWALAPIEVARVIERAHADAVADTLAWLEDHAVYTRSGHRSAQQIETRGLLAAAFTHRDSRAGDPDLHTHVAISNKVQAVDGRWLALDGRPLHKMTVAASERYNTRLEALLVDRLGVAFVDRPTGAGRRPVREIAGIEARLLARWSQRRQVIEVRRGELATEFQAAHGRAPTTVEALALAQQATLETRPGKHEPRSFAAQRRAWRAQAVSALGGERQLAAMLQTVRQQHAVAGLEVTGEWLQRSAATVIGAVQAQRASWQECHVRAEAERVARAACIPIAALDAAVERLVATALGPNHSVPLGAPADDPHEADTGVPAVLRRSDGRSVYTTVGTQLYTSAGVLDAERQLITVAQQRTGRRASAAAVEAALVESLANGRELNPGQAALVRELARSGARLQVALAPAGVGKTTALAVLARAWEGDGGTVLGLAPSAAAAAVLCRELGDAAAHTDTLAKLLDSVTAPDRRTPAWVTQVGPDTLVVIDEAGMAGTVQLAAATRFVLARGGSVRLIGDDQQLAAIGAGGVLRDISETCGAVSLSQVVRFTHPRWGRAEAAASLALRAGDPAAIGFYLDHARVHVGDLAIATDQAYQAWAADRAGGRDALLLAPTRDIVAALNTRARGDRLAEAGARPGTSPGREVTLVDGARACAGDLIITRDNRRDLAISATDWVKNGDRFRITSVRRTGALDVRHLATGRRLTLPADYAAEHVTLGYATTVHTAQGITADTCHLVAAGTETRQLLYVGLTRGRQTNHIYLATASDGDPHDVITRDALLPPTPADLLIRILGRDEAPLSATSSQRALTAAGPRLAAAATRYYDALLTAAIDRLGPAALARLDAAANAALPGLTAAPAYPSLRGALALAALDGHPPATLLTQTIDRRELATAEDPAAVLHWRLTPHPPVPDCARTVDPWHRSPLPWLPAIPTALSDDPAWGSYLHRAAEHTATLATQVATETRTWTASTAPAWALPLVTANADPPNHPAADDPITELIADVAMWRAATDTDASDPNPVGPPRPLTAEARHQRALQRRITAYLGDPHADATRWRRLADQVDRRLATDPYWPQLAARLSTAHRAGIDIAALTRRVTTERPLPEDAPAAALWWRLAQHLSPAALPDTHPAAALRPAWLPAVTALLGAAGAQRALTDPAWPALVAAVTVATGQGWQPGDLLAAAHALTLAGSPPDAQPRPEEMVTALAWQIAMLTDPPPDDDDGRTEPDCGDPRDRGDLPVPTDLDRLGEVAGPADAAWWASLDPPTEPTPAPARPDAASPAGADVVGKLEAVFAFDRYTAPEPDWDHALLEAHRWATAPVPRDRLIALNDQALSYYTDHYPGSWAQAHLRQRLGTDLRPDARFSVGYAPPGWTRLVDHLRRLGATDEELLAVGLAVQSRRGGLIDVFRDRLVLPVRDPDADVVGFIARRHPDADEHAGPKYLNTRTTDLFRKGECLFGLAENQAALRDKAIPVLVEGPLDAIAVSLAGGEAFAGLAPLGTALTNDQAEQLRPLLRPYRRVVVATDADMAGRAAAQRAYWLLTARGDTPARLALPDGIDPAELLQMHGPGALRTALDNADDLAVALIATRLTDHRTSGDPAANREQVVADIAAILGALPPDRWLQAFEQVSASLDVPLARLQLATVDAAHTWSLDPHAAARRQLTSGPTGRARPQPTGAPRTAARTLGTTRQAETKPVASTHRR